MEYTISKIVFQWDTCLLVQFNEAEKTALISKQPEDEYKVGDTVKSPFY